MNQRNSHAVSGAVDVRVGHSIFDRIVSLENLLLAWREFRRGKRAKPDVQQFELNLEDNLFKIHRELTDKTYRNAPYDSFYITDPKLRHIHKASAKDRVVHQAVFRVLYPMYDSGFIFDSYSCRIARGTHRGVARLERFLGRVSKNFHGPAYALKCDIRKFFDTVDHTVLLSLIQKKAHDLSTLWLLRQIVDSFSVSPSKGLPLGNVTSQLFSNIYLNKLDHFVKHKLRAEYYLRYCDDFVVLADNLEELIALVPKITKFLKQALKLELHERKVVLRKYHQGIDFLGYIALPHYRVLRAKTKRRMFRRIRRKRLEFNKGLVNQYSFQQSLNSYLGMCKHCRSFKITSLIKTVVNLIFPLFVLP